MKFMSLALATALAAIVGCAQPAAAQTQDQTGAAASERPASYGNGNATVGSGHSEDRGYDDRRPMVMPARPMAPQRRMMLRGMGAQFHFARGNARIDVTCSVQEDTEACVRAAGLLIDKIAELHGREGRSDMTGSANRDGRRAGADPESEDHDGEGALGERM